MKRGRLLNLCSYMYHHKIIITPTWVFILTLSKCENAEVCMYNPTPTPNHFLVPTKPTLKEDALISPPHHSTDSSLFPAEPGARDPLKIVGQWRTFTSTLTLLNHHQLHQISQVKVVQFMTMTTSTALTDDWMRCFLYCDMFYVFISVKHERKGVTSSTLCLFWAPGHLGPRAKGTRRSRWGPAVLGLGLLCAGLLAGLLVLAVRCEFE